MADIYEEKIECDFCNKNGFIEVINFHYVSIKNRVIWNKETRINNLKQERLCPLCDGRGYLHIIKKKTK